MLLPWRINRFSPEVYYINIYDVNDKSIYIPYAVTDCKEEARLTLCHIFEYEEYRRSIHRVMVQLLRPIFRSFSWFSISENEDAELFYLNSGVPFDSCKVNFYSYFDDLIHTIRQKSDIDWRSIRKEMLNLDQCLYATKLFHIVGTPEDQYVIEDWRFNLSNQLQVKMIGKREWEK